MSVEYGLPQCIRNRSRTGASVLARTVRTYSQAEVRIVVAPWNPVRWNTLPWPTLAVCSWSSGPLPDRAGKACCPMLVEERYLCRPFPMSVRLVLVMSHLAAEMKVAFERIRAAEGFNGRTKNV